MSLGRNLREAHGRKYGLLSRVDRKLPSNPHGTLGGPTSRAFKEDLCFNYWETKKKRGVRRLVWKRRSKIVCILNWRRT